MEHSPKYSNRTVTKQATQLDLSLPVGSSARVKTPFSYYLVHSSATFKSPYTVQRETLAGEGKFGKLQAKSQLAKKTLANLSPDFIAISYAISNWQVKFWRIHSKSPNSPFPPPKFPSIRQAAQTESSHPVGIFQLVSSHCLARSSHLAHNSASFISPSR